MKDTVIENYTVNSTPSHDRAARIQHMPYFKIYSTYSLTARGWATWSSSLAASQLGAADGLICIFLLTLR